MKKSKKIIICILLLLLIGGNIIGAVAYIGFDKVSAYFSVFSFPDTFDSEHIPFSTYNYDKLSEIEKKAYICIFNNISSHPVYIKVPQINKDEFENVYFAVKNDNPDMLCFSDSCDMYSFGAFSLIALNYSHSDDECDEMQKVLLKKVDEIINSIPDDCVTDYDKELYIHDYIANNCIYEENEYDSSAYGCIVNQKAVCSGYSRAFMLLLNKVGVKSVLIGGTGISSSMGNVSHLWNIVWIENEPYHVDLTWDDGGNSTNSSISHLYFNLTDSEISVNHIDYNSDFVCSSEKYNYFKYNNLYFSSYKKSDLTTIKKILVDNINSGLNFIEMKFELEEDYIYASDTLLNGTSPSSDMYKILSYLSENVNDKIDVSHVSIAKDDNKKYIKLMFDWK